MTESPPPLLSYGVLALLSALFFAVDAVLPARLPVELLQVAVVLLTLFAEGRRPTLVFGGVTTLLVAGGFVVHRLRGAQTASLDALAGHGIVLLGLWTAVAVVLAYKHVRRVQHETEARAQAILDTTVDGIITIDADGVIESFNPAAEDIFGYDAEEVIGQNIKVLMPSPYHEEHDEYLRSYHETGRRKIIGIGREVRGRRKDGSTFPMDLAVSEVELNDRLIFTGIVRDISERRRLEKEILSVSEDERRRIGQDLHDGLGQMLTGIGLLSQDMARDLADEGHPRADDMHEITEHIKEADQYARDLSHGLIPVDVEANGLPEALRRLAQNAERLFNVTCSFREVDTVLVHDNTTATHLYRIAQEAVNNAVRHGDADRVAVFLAAGPERMRLQVRDDGTGFDPNAPHDAGMGIRIMRYRARIIGGTLDISSTRGAGTVVTCTRPHAGPSGDGEADAPARSPTPARACPVARN